MGTAGWWVYNACCLVIDHDEIEHIHNAFLVYKGLLPFRDFVEVHQPGLWFAIAPLFAISSDPVFILMLVRVIFVILFAGTLWFLYRIIESNLNDIGPAAFVVIAAGASVLYARSFLEVRNDGPMVFLIVLAIWFLVRYLRTSVKRYITFSGLALGLAWMFSNKVLPAVAGVGVGVFMAMDGESLKKRAEAVFRFGLYIMIPWAFFLVYLGLTSSMSCYIFWAFTLNKAMHTLANLPNAFSAWKTLAAFFRYDPVLMALASAGILFSIRRLRDPVVAAVMTTLVLGVVMAFTSLLPYKQYMLLPLTMAVVPAGMALNEIRRNRGRTGWQIGVFIALLALGVGSWRWTASIPSNHDQIAGIHRLDNILPQDARVLCMPPVHPITRLDASPLWFNIDLFMMTFEAMKKTGIPALPCVINALKVPKAPPDVIGGLSRKQFLRLARATGATRHFYTKLRGYNIFIRTSFLKKSVP